MPDARVEQIKAAYPAASSIASQIVAVSDRLRIADPAWLANLINFESGGFDPAAYNSGTGASGLIQFMPETAAELGTTTAALRAMSASAQMPYVERYLRKYAGRFKSAIDLYMAVFYPAAIGNPNYRFPDKVVRANNGIATPADYARMANANARLKFTSKSELRNAPGGALSRSAPRSSRAWVWWLAGGLTLVGVVLLVTALPKIKARRAGRALAYRTR